MKQFTKLGYFINSDGIKSTDVDLTTRSFKDHVTLPKRRIGPFSAFVKLQYHPKKNVMGADTKTSEILKSLAQDWPNLSTKKKAEF